MTSWKWLAVSAVLATQVGCGGVRLVDNGDNGAFGNQRMSEGLYVLGADTSFSVRRHGFLVRPDVDNWSIDVDDPSVLSVHLASQDEDWMHYDGVARKEGTTTLNVRNGNGLIREHVPIEVAFPDRVEVHAFEDRMLNRTDQPLQDQPIHVLAGSHVSLEVQYHRGSDRLQGTGVLDLVFDDDSSAVDADLYDDILDDETEWVELCIDEPGTYASEAWVSGTQVGDWSFVAVTPESVEALVLQDSSQWATNQYQSISATGLDAAGNRILGLEPVWFIDGIEQDRAATGVDYTRDETQSFTLTAVWGDYEETVEVWGVDPGLTYPAQSACSTAGPRALGLWTTALVGLLALRRRR